jgi:hypothetical protein
VGGFPIFRDDFDDGDYAGWIEEIGGYARTVSAPGANGTPSALYLANSSLSTYDGLYTTFSPGVQPRRVSWWTKVADSRTSDDQGAFRITGFSFSPTTGVVIRVLVRGESLYRFVGGTTTSSPLESPFVANTWHHLELRNIDWTAKTFDFYVDEALIQAGAGFFHTTATSLERIGLYTGATFPSYWDEIELLR